MIKLVVNDSGIRLDKYISDNVEYSRNNVLKLIENESVLVNGVSQKASYKVKENDVIEINEDILNEEIDIVPQKMNLDIIYEDKDIMVINKPSGLVVHPGSGNKDQTLVNGLLWHTKELSDMNGEERPGIVHRLDKDTSGLMLVAKTNQAHQILSEKFQKHDIKRTYVALVKGVFSHNTATIDAPIGRDKINRKKMCVTKDNSKKAITHLSVIKRYKSYTLVELNLETGRTHQIRVHMSYIGYPVVNDPIYNNKKSDDFGQLLHSKNIEFIHPITNEKMYFECDLPLEFKKYLENLDQEQILD